MKITRFFDEKRVKQKREKKEKFRAFIKGGKFLLKSFLLFVEKKERINKR